MKIETSTPILKHTPTIIANIAKCWNKVSESWNDVWGPHIHHGYYENNEMLAPLQAQEKLIQKLALLLNLQSGQKILDVGCGMGGSSLFLAKYYQAQVVGITLSEKQVDIAKRSLNNFNKDFQKISKDVDILSKDFHTLSKDVDTLSKDLQTLPKDLQTLSVEFKVEDAHSLSTFSANSFDVIWSLESCEQFYDKEKFIKEAFRVLKPGGKLMLATWCSDQESYSGQQAKEYLKVCNAFDLPYMPTIKHYQKLLESHFAVETILDWSNYVKKSWDIGISLLRKYSILRLLKMAGLFGLKFSYKIKYLRKGFNSGSIQYGVFICKKEKPA